jgi:hypothetical protein
MSTPVSSNIDRMLAKVCVNCPVCRNARQRQSGGMYWLVKQVESSLCPKFNLPLK